MNESVRPRFAVDLDEIERQLGHAQPAPQAAPGVQAPAGRGDPLAELARIVGQDDPFGQILANDRPARPRPAEPAGLDDLFDQRAGAAAGLRGTAAPAPAYASQGYEEPQAGEPYDPDYDQPAYHPDGEEEPLAPPPPRGRRKGLIAVGAVLGMAGLGLAGAYAFKGHGGSLLASSGEPPLIKATNEPVKVEPKSPGGIEIPNQNKQIYERSQEGQTKVVTREEQPVDVRQAVRSASTDATGATAPASTGGLNLGEPKRVRTVSIRPDGTVISPDAPAAPPPANPQVASLARPAAAPAPVAVAPTPAPAPVAAATATPPAPAPRTAAATPLTAGGASPQSAQPQAATPAAKPQAPAAPQRVASAMPTAPAAAAASPTSTQAISSPGGGFAVQLGVSPSEGEAKATLQKMQAKYADLSGLSPMIRKAEVNGNTVFRVRVGPMSRDDASSLCSKIQGQGGQCFVAKN